MQGWNALCMYFAMQYLLHYLLDKLMRQGWNALWMRFAVQYLLHYLLDRLMRQGCLGKMPAAPVTALMFSSTEEPGPTSVGKKRYVLPSHLRSLHSVHGRVSRSTNESRCKRERESTGVKCMCCTAICIDLIYVKSCPLIQNSVRRCEFFILWIWLIVSMWKNMASHTLASIAGF